MFASGPKEKFRYVILTATTSGTNKFLKKKKEKSESTADEVVCILSGVSMSDKASELTFTYLSLSFNIRV